MCWMVLWVGVVCSDAAGVVQLYAHMGTGEAAIALGGCSGAQPTITTSVPPSPLTLTLTSSTRPTTLTTSRSRPSPA